MFLSYLQIGRHSDFPWLSWPWHLRKLQSGFFAVCSSLDFVRCLFLIRFTLCIFWQEYFREDDMLSLNPIRKQVNSGFPITEYVCFDDPFFHYLRGTHIYVKRGRGERLFPTACSIPKCSWWLGVIRLKLGVFIDIYSVGGMSGITPAITVISQVVHWQEARNRT